MMQLILEKRGTMDHTETLDTRRVMLHCELPLNEILVDFNDKIKSRSPAATARWITSMPAIARPKLVKLDMLVNGEPVDAFSMHRASRTKPRRAGRAAGGEAEGSDPAPALPGRDPGRDRRKNYRARKCFAPCAKT